ncbi:MAG: RHS repeat-associated core domain-containing protein [Candidatus Kapabacteria bacterium]|nr:RHS repeat-associated core domain-containing protein [Candidatus Kapabacteria bacterium]
MNTYNPLLTPDPAFHGWVYYLLGIGNKQHAVFNGVQAQGLCSDTRKVWMFPVEYNSYAAGDAPLITTRPNGSHEFKIIDHLGGTRMVLSDNATRLTQTDYAPFGKVAWSSGLDERLSWIGKENDNESNLGDFGVRKYDEELGRFLSCDPEWEIDGQRELSVYHYAANNPVLLKDPNGDCPWCWGAVIGGGLEIASQLITDGKVTSWSKVAVSTALGAATGGLSAMSMTGVKIGTQVAFKAIVSGSGAAIETAAHNAIDGKSTSTVSSIRSALLGAASSIGGELVADYAKTTTKGKELTDKAKKLDNVANDGRARNAQAARAASAQKAAKDYGSGPKASATNAAATKVYDEGTKPKENNKPTNDKKKSNNSQK